MQILVEYFAMDGYAGFIWPAYGIATAVLAGLLFTSLRGMRRNEDLAQSLRRQRRAAPESEARP
ncbi:MAG: heme exporter protein CcmD [Alphaproteobacteria bacterium]